MAAAVECLLCTPFFFERRATRLFHAKQFPRCSLGPWNFPLTVLQIMGTEKRHLGVFSAPQCDMGTVV